MSKPVIHSDQVSRGLLWLNTIVALIYISWWFQLWNMGNPILYGLLLFGEVYHVFMALAFWHTIGPAKSRVLPSTTYTPKSVDVFVTVVGEPIEVVRETVLAAKELRYPNHQIYILNDGKAAKKPEWRLMEDLAKELNVHCTSRETNKGFKAGNINNALAQTEGEVVVIFDADMVPHQDFLERVMPYFEDEKVGFVQTPQYYNNYAVNDIAGAAWEQQEFFFGPIMIGKEKSNAAFICGTNVAIRREALMQAGGMCEDNIAEDFLTSLFIHQKKWRSVYVPDVLAEGMAPEDLLSYFKQQLRWARGSLEVLFGFNPVFKSGLSWRQKLEYLSSGLYYFNGLVVVIDAVMPLVFLFSGIQPVDGSTTSFALFFIPFMFLNMYTLHRVSKGSITFRAISFTISSWTLQLIALRSILLKQKMAFSVTPKQAQSGNFLSLAYPHIAYIVLVLIGTGVGVMREGLSPSVITNVAWGMFNVILFIPFIAYAYPWRSLFMRAERVPVPNIEA